MYTYVSATLNAMISAARKAGRLLARDFNEISTIKVTHKSAKEFVTSADLRSEKMILADLKHTHPDYSVLSEEQGFQKGDNDNYTWIVDPLDGTVNFLQGLPFFSIAIALRKKNEITHGVIYDPILDQIFYAEKGSGAYMNSTRLRTPAKSRLPGGMLYVDHHYFMNHASSLKEAHYMRYLGSASLGLAYVASGKFDAFLGKDLKLWDRASGIIMIKEAGGRIDDLHKKESVLEAPYLVAGNPDQFERLRKNLMIQESHG